MYGVCVFYVCCVVCVDMYVRCFGLALLGVLLKFHCVVALCVLVFLCVFLLCVLCVIWLWRVRVCVWFPYVCSRFDVCNL